MTFPNNVPPQYSDLANGLQGLGNTQPLSRVGNLGGMPLAIIEDENLFPGGFPFEAWRDQQTRYLEYWNWYTGNKLDQDSYVVGNTVISKYPLRLNPIANFARKKAAVLFGEPDPISDTLINTKVRPKPFFKDNEKLKEDALFLERIIDEVWRQSGAMALLMQGGILSQFLGGVYYQVEYQPWREDLLVPIKVNLLLPDFVLPITAPDKSEDILECYISYRVPRSVALSHYGYDTEAPYAVYVEHWTREHYSIFIDGKPLVAKYDIPNSDKKYTVTYDKTPHPFGLVPIVYIPRLKTGSFWGQSIVPDLAQVTLEFNARFADLGSLVQESANRVYVGRNIIQQPRVQRVENILSFLNLGAANPSSGKDPELQAVEPPVLSDVIPQNIDMLWKQLLRDGDLTTIHFGEDENGSQRSGETLKARSWSPIATARMERMYWDVGTWHIAKIITIIFNKQNLDIDGKKIDVDILKRVLFSNIWHPIVDHSREQMINEIVQLLAAKAMSPERALILQGNVPDIEEELGLIEKAKQAEIDSQKEVAEHGADLAIKQMKVKQDETDSEPKSSHPAKKPDNRAGS